MSARSARARLTSVAAIVTCVAVVAFAATSRVIGATTPTTTVATTVAPTASAATTPTPTSVAPTTAPPTTFPGPAPRESSRIASPIDIEKIRATSVPFRQLGIAVAIAIVGLAIVGFVYGRVRSRVPTVKAPNVAPIAAGPASPFAPSSLPPPAPIPLPPPVVEDAVADTVIFEPPSSHLAPEVIAEPAEVLDASEDAETSKTPEAPDEPASEAADDRRD